MGLRRWAVDEWTKWGCEDGVYCSKHLLFLVLGEAFGKDC